MSKRNFAKPQSSDSDEVQRDREQEESISPPSMVTRNQQASPQKSPSKRFKDNDDEVDTSSTFHTNTSSESSKLEDSVTRKDSSLSSPSKHHAASTNKNRTSPRKKTSKSSHALSQIGGGKPSGVGQPRSSGSSQPGPSRGRSQPGPSRGRSPLKSPDSTQPGPSRGGQPSFSGRGQPNPSTRKVKRRTPAVINALREIRRYQKDTSLLTRKLPFSRVVKDIIRIHAILRIQANAIEALQAAVEEFISTGLLCTLHRGCVTLTLKDTQLARRIWSRFTSV